MRQHLKSREKTEIALILISALLFSRISSDLPDRTSIGQLLVFGALLLLIQGLFRDLYLLYRRHQKPPKSPARRMRCMCVESTVGLSAILIGGLLSIAFGGFPISLSPTLKTTAFTTILVFGFLAKDWVISWRPLSLRREAEHENIIFRL